MRSMDNLNERISSIAPSVTLAITSKAKKLAAEGQCVFNFAAGEPDCDTPQAIKEAAAEALSAGKTKYTPASGLPELRAAIAEKLLSENGIEYKPEQVIVSNGGKHSLFNVFMTLCRAGDEVIMLGPWWLSYPEMVNIVGAKPVCLYGPEEKGFKVTPEVLERSITDKTKALVINSPSNPAGVVYTRSELEAFAEIAVRRGIWIISDEIYEKIIYEGTEHVSMASLSDEVYNQTVTVNGFSKAFSMTGWRLGYMAAPITLVKAIGALQSHSASGPNTFAQYGAVDAIKNRSQEVAEMVGRFAERRVRMYEKLVGIPGVECVKPMGAFYMFPNISALGLDSVSFAEQLLEAKGVALVPGRPFGSDKNVRLSYACSMDEIEEGLTKLAEFVASLNKT